MPLVFPEARYVEPLDVADDPLGDWIAELLSDLDKEGRQDPDGRGDAVI